MLKPWGVYELRLEEFLSRAGRPGAGRTFPVKPRNFLDLTGDTAAKIFNRPRPVLLKSGFLHAAAVRERATGVSL
jgi:hypothetical protein